MGTAGLQPQEEDMNALISRGIQLPPDVDPGQTKARYDHGVLTLTLPKKQGKGAQKLRIE